MQMPSEFLLFGSDPLDRLSHILEKKVVLLDGSEGIRYPPLLGSRRCLYLPLLFPLSEGLSGFLPLMATIIYDFINEYFSATCQCRSYYPPHLDSASPSLASRVGKIKGPIRFYLNEAFFSCLWNTQFHIPNNDCLC